MERRKREMRSKYVVALAILMVAALTVGLIVTWGGAAERPARGMERGDMRMGGGDMRMAGGDRGMGGRMGTGGGCAMSSMMGRASMVAANDSVYVLAGHKLMRFDRDLKLVNEVEVMPDQESMQRMMQNCPMMQGGGGGGMGGRMGGGGGGGGPRRGR
jgi:hypothetical protein